MRAFRSSAGGAAWFWTPNSRCYLIRNDAERRDADEILDRLLEDPEFKNYSVTKLRAIAGALHGREAR